MKLFCFPSKTLEYYVTLNLGSLWSNKSATKSGYFPLFFYLIFSICSSIDFGDGSTAYDFGLSSK